MRKLSEIYNTDSGAEVFTKDFSAHLNSIDNPGLRYYALSNFGYCWKSAASSWDVQENAYVGRYALEKIDDMPNFYRNELLEEFRRKGLLLTELGSQEQRGQNKRSLFNLNEAQIIPAST